jgi:hypothetical protein
MSEKTSKNVNPPANAPSILDSKESKMPAKEPQKLALTASSGAQPGTQTAAPQTPAPQTAAPATPVAAPQTAAPVAAPQTAAPTASDGRNITITASVGKGGSNQQADVSAVQAALKRVGLSVDINGTADAKTIAAIERFQSTALGFSDGRIDPGGRSLTRLNTTADGAMARATTPTPAPGNGASNVTVNFGSRANRAAVLPAPLAVIKDLVAAAGGRSCLINSTARTPEDQARAMYQNLSAGTRIQYAAAGEAVTRVYERLARQGQSRTAIMTAMIEEINRQGPSRVSRHCADFNTLCVVDIDTGSVPYNAFVAAVNAAIADGRVSNFLYPGNSDDPAFHLEIPVR